jgi:hypothetical protein
MGDAVAPSEALPAADVESVWHVERDGEVEPLVVADAEAHDDSEGVVDALVDVEERAEGVSTTVAVDDTLDETKLEMLGDAPLEGEAKLDVGAAEVEPEIDGNGDALCELDAHGESESVTAPDADAEREGDAVDDDDMDPQDDAERVLDDDGDIEGDAAPEGVGSRVLGAADADTLNESELETLTDAVPEAEGGGVEGADEGDAATDDD